jgi:type I restriction enzyme S subunit
MKLETFFKHFDLLAEAPNGVQKLRELILDLAVRGKLVPQDANDEPAAVLLERIKKEKERLVKEKRIKKTEIQLPISINEIPYKLPHTWEWIRLCYITICRDGERIPISRDERINRQGIYDYYGASGVIDKIDNYLFDKPLLLIGEDGANLINRSTPIAFIATGKYWVNNHAHVLDSISLDFLKYLEIFINAIDLTPYVTGTAQPKMNQAKMNSIPVALPPLAEQKRIVTKVDELMKLCDELEARQKKKQETRILINNAALNKLLTADTPETFTKNWQCIGDNFDLLYSAPENIGKLRQAILQLAVMGKLVPQNANDEPAAVLLERIKKEKERLVKEGKVRKEKSLEPPIKDNEIPYDLPKGWEWVKLDWICNQITDGTHHTPTYISNGVPFLSVKDISSGRFDLTNTKFISHGEHQQLIKRCYPEFNDVLLTKVGTTGIAKVIDIDIEFSIFVSVALLKISKYLLSPYYIELVINSPLVKEQSKNNTQGVGNKNLVLRCIKSFDLPLPPIQEQKRIVTKVDKLMKLCDELETKLTQTQTEREKIINAAVKQLLTV